MAFSALGRIALAVGALLGGPRLSPQLGRIVRVLRDALVAGAGPGGSGPGVVERALARVSDAGGVLGGMLVMKGWGYEWGSVEGGGSVHELGEGGERRGGA